MAIIFQTPIETDKWLFTDNNNILEYSDDVNTREPLYSDILIPDVSPIRVFPRPDGTFYWNALDYVSTLLNDYVDDLDLTQVTQATVNTFIQDWAKAYLEADITITTVFDNGSQEVNNIIGTFILGAENVYDYYRGLSLRDKDLTVLSPAMNSELNTHLIKYWKGYPLDIGYTKSMGGNNLTSITNTRNAQVANFLSPNDVNRLVISDGNVIDFEAYLPFLNGFNKLELKADVNILLEKIDSCGTYFKWMNRYGTFNYWLFCNTQGSLRGRTLGTINNDFNNVKDTQSQSRSLGKRVEEQLIASYDNLSLEDIRVLEGIIESPKVYLYTGEKGSTANFDKWIEVQVANKNIVSNNFKSRVPNGNLTFALPNRYNIKL